MNTNITITSGNVDDAYLCTCGKPVSVKDRQKGGTRCDDCKLKDGAPITRRLDQQFGETDRPQDDYEDYR